MAIAMNSPRTTIVAALVVVLFATTSQAQPAPRAPSAAPPPSGLVAVLTTSAMSDAASRQAVANPSISGVGLQIRWNEIEPVEDKPDWSKVDDVVSTATASKKWLQLLIFPGFFSPSWSLQGVATEQFPIQYGPRRGTMQSLPMPWDPVCLHRWYSFVRLLSARYGNMPSFRMIGAAGPTSVWVEMTLPNSPKDLRVWQADGYASSTYVGAWQSALAEYAADFPKQFVSLALGGGPILDDRGKIDRGEHVRTRDAIVGQAVQTLGSLFALQYCNLDGNDTPDDQGLSFLMGYNGRAVTGLQMRTSASAQGMGADGDSRTCAAAGHRQSDGTECGRTARDLHRGLLA